MPESESACQNVSETILAPTIPSKSRKRGQPTVYGTCNDTQVRRAQKLLNFSARVISGRRKYDHVRDVLRDLEWLDVGQLVRYHRMCLVHATLTSGTPDEIAVTFGETAQHRYETRTACQHALPRIRTEAGRRRLCYSAVRDYDSLPPSVGGRHFRFKLRRYLLEGQNARIQLVTCQPENAAPHSILFILLSWRVTMKTHVFFLMDMS